MDIKKLQRVVVDALEDVKAQNIKVYNTVGLSDMFDRVVLASGTSNRQTRALAYRVAQQVKEAGGHVVSVEGADAGEWVLVDLGDLVVHVMQPAVRDYYGLEEIWGGKPVRVKIAESGARRIVGHAEAAEEDATRPAHAEGSAPARMDGEARKPAQAGSTELAAATIPEAREAPQPPAKTAAKRAPVKRSTKAPAKKAVTRRATKRATGKPGKPAAKPPARTTAPKRPAAKTAPKRPSTAAKRASTKTATGKSSKAAGAPSRKAATKKSVPRKSSAAVRKKAGRA